MRYGAVIGLCGLIACAVPSPPAVPLAYRLTADTCNEGTPRVAPGTVPVITSTGLCTGVVISPTEVLTAGHCVDSAEWAYVDFGPGADGKPRAVFAEFAAKDGPYGEDVALLEIVSPAGAPVATVGAPPVPGDVVTFAGFGCAPTGRTRRAVARPREIAAVHANRYTGCACRGDSGGPVFDRAGDVVGVVTHTNFRDRTWVTEVTALPHLRMMLQALHAQYPATTDPAPR